MTAVLGTGLLCGLGGCRHKTQIAPPMPAIQTPVDLLDIPVPEDLPLLEAAPEKLPPVPIASAAAKLKRSRKKSPKVVAAAPAVVAPVAVGSVADSPETTAIGALTAGGEENPQTKQEAADLIASIEKRLNALPAQTGDSEKAQISKVRNFWRDAAAALKSGDAEGAKTLATKAKLLLDDLEK
jgi:ribosomal protein S20